MKTLFTSGSGRSFACLSALALMASAQQASATEQSLTGISPLDATMAVGQSSGSGARDLRAMTKTFDYDAKGLSQISAAGLQPQGASSTQPVIKDETAAMHDVGAIDQSVDDGHASYSSR